MKLFQTIANIIQGISIIALAIGILFLSKRCNKLQGDIDDIKKNN